MLKLRPTLRRAALCFALSVAVQAQVRAQSETQSEAITRYSAEYMHAAGDNAALFSGKIQDRLYGNIESIYMRERGHIDRDAFGDPITPRPVNPIDSYATGNILYDGVLYAGVRMRLDIYRDQLVVAAPGSSFYGAQLNPERVEYADLRGYRIIHKPAPALHGDLPAGYYLQLLDNHVELLKKEYIQFDMSSVSFKAYTVRYYLKKEGVYHRLTRRKSTVLRALRDRRGELNRYIRANGLDVRKDTERALVEIVTEYERLTTDR